MIIRSHLRPQRILQAPFKAKVCDSKHRKSLRDPSSHHIQASYVTRSRGHELPLIGPHAKEFNENGVPGLYSKEGFHIAWTDYQGMLVEKLNEKTLGLLLTLLQYKSTDILKSVGTADEGKHQRDLVFQYAHDSSNAALFNYASMAGNNHHFFERLSPVETNPSPTFMKEIRDSFDSIETLRTEMIETADAMFGNGFVWLFKEDGAGLLRILCTYNAGSPWPDAHYRRQSRDMNTTYAKVVQSPDENERLSTVQNAAGKFGLPPAEPVATLGQLKGGPILCVNVWQHAYLPDYGVQGKRKYLQNWWNRINWSVVEEAATHYGSEWAFRRGFLRPTSLLGNRILRSMSR